VSTTGVHKSEKKKVKARARWPSQYGLAAAQKSARREQIHATAAISGKSAHRRATFGSASACGVGLWALGRGPRPAKSGWHSNPKTRASSRGPGIWSFRQGALMIDP
jgi:hypothetical protein